MLGGGGNEDFPHLALTCSAGTRTQLVKYGLLVSSRVTKASSWCLLLSRLSGSLWRETGDKKNKKKRRDRCDVTRDTRYTNREQKRRAGTRKTSSADQEAEG